MQRIKAFCLAAGLLALSACGGEVLYSNLEESEANQIVSVLRAEGLKAKKEARGGQFRVTTSSQHFVVANDLLNRAGLPRRDYNTTDKMFEGGNLVPVPSEQKIREEYTRAQEIEKSLEDIEGIAQASVHITLPDPPRINQEPGKSSASVIVHHYADVDISTFRMNIKPMVASAVEGLSPENTSVVFFPRKRIQINSAVATPTSGASTGMPPNRLGLGIGLSVAALLVGLLGWLLWSGRTIIPARKLAHVQDDAPSLSNDDGEA